MNKTVKIAALIYAVSIFLSRIVGLLRELVIGRILGDQPEADVYWVAFILPDFLNYLLAGGALSLVLIPLLQSANQRGGHEEYWRCFWRIATPLSVLIIGATLALWVFTPQITPLISPGFSPAQFELLNRLTRIILPAQVFHVCGGLISATLQANDRHLAPAISPLVYTGMIILGGLVLGSNIGAEGFAWGVLLGSFLGPFMCPLIASVGGGIRIFPHFDLSHEEVKKYLWRALPVMLGFSVVVLDDMLVKRGATSLGKGLVSQLHYARTLMKVPMGVFGLAMGMAAFPSISRLIAQKRQSEALNLIKSAAEALFVLVGISQAALSVASADAAALIWGTSRLSLESIEAIGAYCTILCLGLWGWSLQGLIARGFYAKGQTWLPTLIGSVVALSFYPIYGWMGGEAGYAFNKALASFGYTVGDGAGLAFTSSLAISCYVILLWGALCLSFGQRWTSSLGLLGTLIKVELAVIIAVWVCQYQFIGDQSDSVLRILVSAVGKVTLSSVVFITVASLLRVKALGVLKEKIMAKVNR